MGEARQFICGMQINHGMMLIDVTSLLLFLSVRMVSVFVSVKRNHSTDYPVLGFFAYVGNDVCNR